MLGENHVRNPRKRPASSSSSRSDRALEEGETPLVEVVDTGRDEEGVDGEGEVRAAKSELAASEMRSEARFWLFVNLCKHVPSVSRWHRHHDPETGQMEMGEHS